MPATQKKTTLANGLLSGFGVKTLKNYLFMKDIFSKYFV